MTDIKQKYCKIKYDRNKWREIYIPTQEKLSEMLDRQYSDAYISCGKYLNPKGTPIPYGSTYRYDQRKKGFIYADIVLDFDQQTRENIISTIGYLEKINSHIEQDNSLTYTTPKIRYILKTSKGNYQCIMSNNFIPNTPLTEQQLKETYRDERKKIINALIKEGLVCDYTVLTDPESRVIRMPNSKHHSGFMTKLINQNEIITEKKEKEPKIEPETITISYLSMSNQCPKQKDKYVPILTYGSYKEQELTRLSQTYKLGNVYVIYNGTEYIAMPLKTVSRKRLEKIAKASTATNKQTIIKYGQTFTRISSQKDTDTQKEYNMWAKRYNVIRQPDTPGTFSKAHGIFLRWLEFTITEELTGYETMPKITVTTVKRRVDEI